MDKRKHKRIVLPPSDLMFLPIFGASLMRKNVDNEND